MGKNFHKNPNVWGNVVAKPKGYKRNIFNKIRQYEVIIGCYVGDPYFSDLYGNYLLVVPFDSNGNIDNDKFISEFYNKYNIRLNEKDLDIMFFYKDGDPIQIIQKIHTTGENIKKLNNYIRLQKIKSLL